MIKLVNKKLTTFSVIFKLHLLRVSFIYTFICIATLTACTHTDRHSNAFAANQSTVSIKEIMTGIIEPASNTLWGAALDDNIPQTNSDWDTLEQAAIQLIVATSSISSGGSGINDNAWANTEEWQTYNDQMASVSEEILNLIRERKYDDMLDAGNVLIEPCGACHTAFPGDSQ
ncbi:MAG: hypothetical protein ACRBCS_11475 [Cellvibrionaceae bacterium]